MGAGPAMVSYNPEQDAYAILGVAPTATQEDIDQAYRKAALMWHPDKTPAPDAAEHFAEVQQAALILRNSRKRKRYDRLREMHLGPAARARSKTTRTRPIPEHREFVPVPNPPDWLAERVKVHYDSVLLTLELPRERQRATAIANALALVCLGAGITTAEPVLGALCLVLWGIGRVLHVPPHKGRMAWAKIIPGRQEAEYHMLDQRHSRYDRLTVPFHALRIMVVEVRDNAYRIEIQGFPRAAIPVLHETRDHTEAKRCAREAGIWLQMPYAA